MVKSVVGSALPGTTRPDDERADPAAVPSLPSRRVWRRPHRMSVGVLALGVAVTGVLAWTSASLYNSNEKRLLDLRAREAGAVVSEALVAVQTPLTSAAELAQATHGDAVNFNKFLAPYVGPGRIFATASLWALDGGRPRLMAVEGAAPQLAHTPSRAAAFFAELQRSGQLSVTGIIGQKQLRVGYGLAAAGSPQFAAYVETRLPPDRRLTFAQDSAFSELNYAFYLGDDKRAADLLATSERSLPLTGRTASTVLPFGTGRFTLVMSPIGSLSGTFFERLPWGILVLGILLSLGAAWMTERLVRGRRYAEQVATRMDEIAVENIQLYAEQRTIAETLQHALLPGELPSLSGLDVEVRYLPGVEGVDIGGDWYDVLQLDEHRLLLVVGDVSGRGLRPATIMASLRHAVRAYASQGDAPSTILSKLSRVMSLDGEDHFATVLCSVVDIRSHELTLANAGHPGPLLIDEHGAHFVTTIVGPPVGVDDDANLRVRHARGASCGRPWWRTPTG